MELNIEFSALSAVHLEWNSERLIEIGQHLSAVHCTNKKVAKLSSSRDTVSGLPDNSPTN